MRVRAIVLTLLSAIAVSTASPVDAQAPKKAARIGVLYPSGDNPVFRANFEGFRQGMAAAGWVDGKNLTFEYRFGDTPKRTTELGVALARENVDLILGIATGGVEAARTATTRIPVVALDLETDPIAAGLVKSLPRPGGNLTGVFLDLPELAGKWIELLKATAPALSRVAVLWDPATRSAQWDAARQAAQVLRLQVIGVQARTVADIDDAFRTAVQERANGVVVLTSPLFNAGRKRIIELEAQHRLPTVLPFPGFAKDGGLVAYGPDVFTMYGQCAVIASKILAGTPPSNIPIERPTRFSLSFNRKTAKALGLEIPPSLLLRADEVFE
ncbi:MAG: ABC transporter substrate-binding protein [Candidatus Rokubacteria bacterium]|nr:ABC transporter substrate-binding protein [Candidatus Rokubacteria bacterium]